MKKYLTLLFLFLFMINAKANRINSIKMDIDIAKDGVAYVTEVWDVYTDSGTEVYKPYYNLGNSKFLDFRVKDSNYNYVPLDSWDVNGSLEDKKYKSGINYVDDGLELCFGISNFQTNLRCPK